mmetsp:Transcript_81647/g.143994  ORF Transcript_81647/g.143994 Transcript_81647/m.143994 type:complete len:82 (+) Transcript_81647:391-636(+)
MGSGPGQEGSALLPNPHTVPTPFSTLIQSAAEESSPPKPHLKRRIFATEGGHPGLHATPCTTVTRSPACKYPIHLVLNASG